MVSDAQVLGAIDDALLATLDALLASGAPSMGSTVWLPRRRSVRPYAQQWVLLSKIQLMLSNAQRCSLRDLHYQLKPTQLFTGPSDLSNALVRVLALLSAQLGCAALPRSAVHITAAPKGVVAGPLHLRTPDGVQIDVSARPWSIPGDVSEISTLVASAPAARFLLVVEKHTVFQQLVDAQFPQAYATILCTGRGFPDLATRAFVRVLDDQLRLVPMCLTDWNPSGVQIFLSYREASSAQASMEGERVRVPRMRWLGLHHADVDRLPPSRFEALTQRDRSICRGLLARSLPDSATERLIKNEVDKMVATDAKTDIDHIGRTSAAAGDSTSGAHGGPASGAVASSASAAQDVTLAQLIARKLMRAVASPG